jgi:hypothetical protein
MGLYLFWYSLTTILGFKEYGRDRFKYFKLEFDVGSQDLPENFATIFFVPQLKLLFRGCSVWSSNNLTAVRSGRSVSFPAVSFSPALLVDGFSVIPAFDSNSTTQGALWLKGSSDNGTTWIPVASSSGRSVVEGMRFPKNYPTKSWQAGIELSFEIVCPGL